MKLLETAPHQASCSPETLRSPTGDIRVLDAPATKSDDPALAETTWPMPGPRMTAAMDALIWNRPADHVLAFAVSVMAAYSALVRDGTTGPQLKRLAALRRVYRGRRRQ